MYGTHSRRLRTIRLLLYVVVLCGLGPTAFAQSPPPVPPEYQDVAAELSTALRQLESVIQAGWDGSKPPVLFSAHLSSANCFRGPGLLVPGYYDTAVLLELDGLKALGVQAITIDLSFPLLHPGFHQTPEERQLYIDFYIRLANDIRARGLKLIVDSQVILSQGVFSNGSVGAFYDSLTVEEYRSGRAEVIETIAMNLHPDYLSVLGEPDTEADQTGKPEIGTVDGSTAILSAILTRLQAAGVQGIAIGAGIGTWQTSYLDYIQSYAATSIDFIDMHVYPVQRDYLLRALEIANIATASGKKVAMAENWLFKIRESELGGLSYDEVSARNAFSFWQPLDARSLRAMVLLAYYKGFDFIAPFWSGYFREYVDYTAETSVMSPSVLQSRVHDVQSASMQTGLYSRTGIAYIAAMLGGPDTTPPDTPTGLSADVTSSTANLSWVPPTDNVGPARYKIFRDDTEVTTTAWTSFFENGLSDGQTYVYTVVALDASGNVSLPASLPVTTPDRTPPSVPTGLAAVTEFAGSQANVALSWSPSTDNVGVVKYRVLRGGSGAPLTAIALVTTTAYTNLNVRPEVAYEYAVEAVDAVGNTSDSSPIAVVTPPPIPDVAAPRAQIGYPAEGDILSREALLYAEAFDLKGGYYDVPSGVAGVQFAIDGVDVGPEQTIPYRSFEQYSVYRLQVNTRTLTDGAHVVTARVRDNAGNTSTSPPIMVKIRN